MDYAFRCAMHKARRQAGLYFAGLLSEDRITEACGKAIRLARLDLHTGSHTV